MSAIRALGLLSGGLDSALAARLLLDQGIEVVGLHLESPTSCRDDVHEVARELAIPLVTRPKGAEYLRLLRHPRFGYGRNMNPCVDCRVFMFRLGRPYLEEFGARFLFTGEVVGQRPMSQMRERMLQIDREADLEGWVLRPLSALRLPETEPERRRWVDRARLFGIMGRARHEQIALAAHYGLRHTTAPGGGCLLTDANYSRKLRDLFAHSPESATTAGDVELLALGRHFRYEGGLKIVLGRDEAENRRLAAYESDGRWLVEPVGFRGPSALVCGPRGEEPLARAMELIRHYARDAAPDATVRWCDQDRVRTRALGVPASPMASLPAAL